MAIVIAFSSGMNENRAVAMHFSLKMAHVAVSLAASMMDSTPVRGSN